MLKHGKPKLDGRQYNWAIAQGKILPQQINRYTKQKLSSDIFTAPMLVNKQQVTFDG